jgi:hypothetical protein
MTRLSLVAFIEMTQYVTWKQITATPCAHFLEHLIMIDHSHCTTGPLFLWLSGTFVSLSSSIPHALE